MRITSPSIDLIAALLLGVPMHVQAQAETTGPAERPPLYRPSLLVGANPLAAVPPQGSLQRPDPVSNGIGYGALIGAGAGAALIAVLYAQCDGTCDAPERAPMYASAMTVGAGAGAVAGWLVDRARHDTGRRVRIATLVTPRRQAVRVTLRF